MASATALNLPFCNSLETPQLEWGPRLREAKKRMDRVAQVGLSTFGRAGAVAAYSLAMVTWHMEHGGFPPGGEAEELERLAARHSKDLVILAVSNEPYLVFASNAFAILGLRALYFVLKTIMDAFRFLKVGLGLVLWLYYGIGLLGEGNGWMHAKLTLVLLALGYHHGCGRLLRKFERGENAHGHVWFRWFNEIPVVLLTLVVILVVVKPF